VHPVASAGFWLRTIVRRKCEVVLLYYNCHHKGLFEDDPACRVESLGEVSPLPAALITPRHVPAMPPQTAPVPA
jgi:hypothetical protein